MIDRYGTVEGFRAYHSERDTPLPIAATEDDAIEAWLLVGSEWVDGRYRASFPGYKVGMRSQVREYPRVGGYDAYGYLVASDSIPREIEWATYEIALRQGNNPGSLTTDFTPSKYKSVNIDGISVTFADGVSASSLQTQYAALDHIMAGLLPSSGFARSSLSGGSFRV